MRKKVRLRKAKDAMMLRDGIGLVDDLQHGRRQTVERRQSRENRGREVRAEIHVIETALCTIDGMRGRRGERQERGEEIVPKLAHGVGDR